jgi:hypothetical protein
MPGVMMVAVALLAVQALWCMAWGLALVSIFVLYYVLQVEVALTRSTT